MLDQDEGGGTLGAWVGSGGGGGPPNGIGYASPIGLFGTSGGGGRAAQGIPGKGGGYRDSLGAIPGRGGGLIALLGTATSVYEQTEGSMPSLSFSLSESDYPKKSIFGRLLSSGMIC
jgi:hypothetical protein